MIFGLTEEIPTQGISSVNPKTSKKPIYRHSSTCCYDGRRSQISLLFRQGGVWRLRRGYSFHRGCCKLLDGFRCSPVNTARAASTGKTLLPNEFSRLVAANVVLQGKFLLGSWEVGSRPANAARWRKESFVRHMGLPPSTPQVLHWQGKKFFGREHRTSPVNAACAALTGENSVAEMGVPPLMPHVPRARKQKHFGGKMVFPRQRRTCCVDGGEILLGYWEVAPHQRRTCCVDGGKVLLANWEVPQQRSTCCVEGANRLLGRSGGSPSTPHVRRWGEKTLPLKWLDQANHNSNIFDQITLAN